MQHFRCSDTKWSVTFQSRYLSSKQDKTHLAYKVSHNDVMWDKNVGFFQSNLLELKVSSQTVSNCLNK